MKSSAKKKAAPKAKVNVARARKAAPRFVLIGKNGKPLGRSTASAVAVLDTQQNLMLDLAESEPMPHADAMAAAAAVRTAGFSDWRAPTSKELFGFVDHAQFRPACDPALRFFSEAYWTSTPVASDPDYAWAVYFYYGYFGIYYRFNRCRVRAVRSAAPASQ